MSKLRGAGTPKDDTAKQATGKGLNMTRTLEEPFSGAKAHGVFAALTARLKSCPDTKRPFEPRSACSLLPRVEFKRLASRLNPRPSKSRKVLAKKYLPAFASLRGWMCAAVLCLAAAATLAQQPVAVSAAQTPASKPENHITAEQQRQLFGTVDELIKFSSEETGLPIKSQVKRQITSRAAVESYVKGKLEEDESTRRLQRDEIVLKKFGLLDRDFELKPFLLALLKEQVEAYYDSKDKTVYLLDWVDIDEQKPVLAHELTHALQDQHSNLEKWNDQTPKDVSLNASDDRDHLAKDEMDTAREAVVEGQATAVMMDYLLKPAGKSLVTAPEVMDFVKQQMAVSESSPVLARAPLLLSESMIFPYREGLSFEQDVWMDQGREAAFAGALDRPPTSSWEIINPREYEQQHRPALPLLPNIHPLVDKLYTPYDIGQMGQLDVRILTELFGGDQAARDLTPAWDGGFYWAGQRRSAKIRQEQANTNSIALFYLSAWKNAASAIYAKELDRKYSGVHLDPNAKAEAAEGLTAESQEQVYTTNEGPVVITIRGKLVFVTESFPLDVARPLTSLVLDAQGTGETRMAQNQPATLSAPVLASEAMEPLTANLIRFFSNCGAMKAGVEAGIRGARALK
jgi:hypothetical protein